MEKGALTGTQHRRFVRALVFCGQFATPLSTAPPFSEITTCLPVEFIFAAWQTSTLPVRLSAKSPAPSSASFQKSSSHPRPSTHGLRHPCICRPTGYATVRTGVGQFNVPAANMR